VEKQSEAGKLQSKQGQQQAANRGRNSWNSWRDLFGTSATASGRTRDDSEIPGVQTAAGSFIMGVSTTEIPREDAPPNPEPIATVSTDQSDYGPGETVLITTSGFQPGTSITFALADDPQEPGDDGEADLYPSFSVTDGGAADQDGVVDGRVVTSWLVPTDDDGTGSGRPDALNATVLLTATGGDGEVATVTFRDSLSPTINLTNANSNDTIGGAIFSSAVFNAGTGLINPFLNIQATGTEQGYNTDNGTPLDTKEPNTTSLPVLSVPIAYIGKTPYLDFRLDINENINAAGDQFLSLDALKIYITNDNNTTGFTPPDPSGTFPSGATLIYDLDATADNWVGLNAALQPGSGYGDISVFVPAGLFYTDASLYPFRGRDSQKTHEATEPPAG
jgi:hypothetical protein